MTDHSHFVGAQELARRIEAYWRGKGFNGIVASAAQVSPAKTANGVPVYGVRSNIKNGYPPK